MAAAWVGVDLVERVGEVAAGSSRRRHRRRHLCLGWDERCLVVGGAIAGLVAMLLGREA